MRKGCGHAFDLLNLDGTDLRSRPLLERRKLLAKVLKKAPDKIRFSEDIFLAQILGHRLLGPGAALSVGQSYKDFYVKT